MSYTVARVARLANTQFGVVARAQAGELGLTQHMERHRLRTGEFELMSPRVLRVAGAPDSWRQRLMAACLEGGPGTAISHRAAAGIHRLDTFEPGVVEVTTERGRTIKPAPRVIVHRSRNLPGVDVVMIGPLPVTTVARTLLDLRAVVGEERLLHGFDSALRDGLLSLPFLRWRFEDLERLGRPWSAAIRRLAAENQAERRPKSVLERKFLKIVECTGLPRPLCQHEIREQGRLLAIVDFAWPERLLAIELDGHGSHATRTQRRHDARRKDELIARGWQVPTFTWEQVTQEPDWVASMVVRLFGAGVDLATYTRHSRPRPKG